MEDKKELLTSERDYGTQILDIIRSGLSDDEIRIQLEEYHEKDIAIVFEELAPEERERISDILGIEIISEVVSFLDDAGEYLSEIEADEAADIIASSVSICSMMPLFMIATLSEMAKHSS